MPYVDGFVIPVTKDKVEVYKAHARKVGEVWMELGALSSSNASATTCLMASSPRFRARCRPSDDEVVIFSWIVYKSRADRDAIMEKVMADPRLKGDMPFDGKRMIFGGFDVMIQM